MALGSARAPITIGGMCAQCDNPDAAVAVEALVAPADGWLVREPHFSMTFLKCRGCSRLWLRVFSELIDWEGGGDDPQAWIYIPLTADEATLLRQATPDGAERALTSMKLARRHIRHIHPRGMEMSIDWFDGPVILLPHD